MSNKHVRHVGKKEKARRLRQAKKKAPKKRPVVQEPEPQEAVVPTFTNAEIHAAVESVESEQQPDLENLE